MFEASIGARFGTGLIYLYRFGNYPVASRQMHFINVICCSCWAGTTTILFSLTVPKSEIGRARRLSVSVDCFAIAIRQILSREEVTVDLKNVEKNRYNSDRRIYFLSYRRQARKKWWEILGFISLHLFHNFLAGNETVYPFVKICCRRIYSWLPKDKSWSFSILHQILFVWQWLFFKHEMFMWRGLWNELRQKQ